MKDQRNANLVIKHGELLFAIGKVLLIVFAIAFGLLAAVVLIAAAKDGLVAVIAALTFNVFGPYEFVKFFVGIAYLGILFGAFGPVLYFSGLHFLAFGQIAYNTGLTEKSNAVATDELPEL